MMAAYNEAEDLINIGAYARGSNPQIDRALGFVEPIGAFLRQRAEEGESFDKHVQRLMGIMAAEAPAEAQI
jgi:flagellar biosynthesis/type III secretory pathway ATPase